MTDRLAAKNELVDILRRVLAGPEEVKSQALRAGYHENELPTSGSAKNWINWFVNDLIARRQYSKLVEFCKVETPEHQESIERLLYVMTGQFRSPIDAELERFKRQLARGNFHRALQLAGTLEGQRGPEEPSKSAQPQGTDATGTIAGKYGPGGRHSESWGVTKRALGHLAKPWELLLPLLAPPFDPDVADYDRDATSRAWAAIRDLELAQSLFGGPWDCPDAERETELLRHRLCFALNRHPVRRSNPICPYQTVVLNMHRNHPSTAARIALLWCVTLIWDLLGKPSQEAGRHPLGPMAVWYEAQLACGLVADLSSPEPAIASLLASAGACLRDFFRQPGPHRTVAMPWGHVVSTEGLPRDLDVWLVHALVNPDIASPGARQLRRAADSSAAAGPPSDEGVPRGSVSEPVGSTSREGYGAVTGASVPPSAVKAES